MARPRLDALTFNMTRQQKQFADRYIETLKGAESCIFAKYGAKNATAMAWQLLQKPHIKEYVDKALSSRLMGGDEVVKRISAIAKTNLADYFVSQKVERRPQIQIPLKQAIKTLNDDILFEREFIETAELTGMPRKVALEEIAVMELRLVRMQMQLKRNKKATIIVEGEPVMVDEVRLDMAKLVADKESGILKSVKFKDGGYIIEAYNADAALNTLARIHGKFAKDNEQSTINFAKKLKIGYGSDGDKRS